MKHITLFLMLTIGIGGLLFPEETLSFKEAVAIALERNHRVLMARNNADIARNNVHIGNADLLPGVNLSSSATFQDPAPGSGESAAATTTTAQVQVTYTLFDGLGNVYRYKKLQAGGDLGELEARDAIEATLLEVGTAFYTAASAYENVQIARELLSISAERLARAKKRSAYGQARTIDVLSAQVDYRADQVTVTQAKFLWDESRRRLNVLLDRQIDHVFTIDTTVTFRQEFDPDQLKASALANNAAYLAAQKRLAQSGYELQIARSRFLPRLDFSGSFGYSQTAPRLEIGFGDAEPALRLGATLSLNLFNGFKTRIQSRNAAIQQKNQALTLAQTRLNLEKEVISAYESYRNSLQVLDLEKEYVEAAGLNFKRTRELYGLGQVTTTQFREAQLNLIRSRSSEATAKYEARIKEIELRRLTGQLLL
jgi:adhesin transport system outer membrane protein